MKKNFRPSSSSKDLSINRSLAGDLKLVTNYTGNIYKIRPGPVLPDPRYLSKVCPTKITTDKEKLYEENINLKQMYNFINDENLKLRTKIIQLEKNSEKKTVFSSPNGKNSHLIEGLNTKIKDLKTEVQAKDKEIEDMKQYVRYTKMQELEGEVRQFTGECMRLKRIIDDLLQEKGIVSAGSGIYEKVRKDNEEMAKLIKFYKETDQVKNEKIEELQKKIKEQNSYKGKNKPETGPLKNELEMENRKLRETIERLESEIMKKNAEIERLSLEILKKSEISEDQNRSSFINDIVEDSDNSKTNVERPESGLVQEFFRKIRDFLSSHKITSEKWINSINKTGIISKSELKSALVQDGIPVSDEEIKNFMKMHGENDNQILSSVIIDLFQGSECEVLSIDEAFEEIKAKSTCLGITSIEKYFEMSLPEIEISESDIITLFTKGLFCIDNRLTVSLLVNFFLNNHSYINKPDLISKVTEKFTDWVQLGHSEIQGILNRFQALLFESYEDLICRLQEKTRFQSFIELNELVKELKVYEVISNDSEECCAKAIFYFYSQSVKKIPYQQILLILYENDVDQKFFETISNKSNDEEFRKSMDYQLTSEQDSDDENYEKLNKDYENIN